MRSIFQVIRSKIIQMPLEPYAFEAMIRTKAGTAIRLLSVHYFLGSYISFIIMIINYISQIFHA